MTPLTSAALLAAIADVPRNVTIADPGGLGADSGPDPDWRSDWDADRAAERWENSVRRWWP